jgi:uncharacterized protein YaaN involved in tellurite resistance
MLDETFARLVAEEVKNRVTDEQREYLRLPEKWGKWQRALVTLTENLERQLNDLKEQEEADTKRYRNLGDEGLKLLAESLSEYENRRKKINRFKFHVDARLDEITRTIALGTDAVDERLKTVDFLRKAIERHRSLLEELDMESTTVDQALWAALDGKWDFDDISLDDIDD